MEILLWLVPSAVVAAAAMVWAAWAGRPRREQRDRSAAAYERFARAIAKEHPTAGSPRPRAARDRSTGIAVRPSRGAGVGTTGPTGDRTGGTRRSA